MNSSDIVDPADASLQELLAQLAEHTDDEDSREKIIDLMLTIPPIAQWPPEMLAEWRKTYDYIRGLRRQLEQRHLERMYNDGGDASR